MPTQDEVNSQLKVLLGEDLKVKATLQLPAALHVTGLATDCTDQGFSQRLLSTGYFVQVAGTSLWSAMQRSKTGPVCLPGAASGQSQGNLFVSGMDHHRATSAHCAASRFRAAHYQQVISRSCDQHACIQPAADAAQGRCKHMLSQWCCVQHNVTHTDAGS